MEVSISLIQVPWAGIGPELERPSAVTMGNSHIGIDWMCIFLAVIGWCSRRSDFVQSNIEIKATPTAMNADELMGRVSARLVRFSRLIDS